MQILKENNIETTVLIHNELEQATGEIWSVLGVIKQSASNIPFKGNDYINHLRELLSLNPKATTTQPKLLLSEHKINKHYGIIMTDTKQLAIKFYDRLRIETQVPDGSSSEIYTPDYIKSGIFMPYIQAMRSKGIIYTLLDVSDPEFNDILSNECNWQNCLKILGQL